MRVAVRLLGEADAIEYRHLPDPLPNCLGLVEPKRRAHTSGGCERGIDQILLQGLWSRHEQVFRLCKWPKVFRPSLAGVKRRALPSSAASRPFSCTSAY